ncbi:hypothetical protein BO86DRAFT_246539 [Aspergillus japonicus CBS 114.51]|uniref:Uncharacterized protein n=1 Tax=Aspergillus japonicus CBS 114.51 TaxID=1448312 RepID=A0A8T8WMC2_ASPJA|nr:hypothetical protein BO86DRAFT_246539 [Aspergillus japonicus CBS 114.51]RAH76710.1 hypothetical protein BO86DRAFT_246539 [Aspergillus japonicus CBS 114.51]
MSHLVSPTLSCLSRTIALPASKFPPTLHQVSTFPTRTARCKWSFETNVIEAEVTCRARLESTAFVSSSSLAMKAYSRLSALESPTGRSPTRFTHARTHPPIHPRLLWHPIRSDPTPGFLGYTRVKYACM